MTSDRARGWAVRDSTGLQVNTVAATRRAAIINWLVSCCRVGVQQWWDDQRVEAMYMAHGAPRKAHCIEVTVTPWQH